MITDFNNEIRVVENVDLIVESSTKKEDYVDKDKALRNIVKFEKGCDKIEITTTTGLLDDNKMSIIASNHITLNLTRLTGNNNSNGRTLTVSMVSRIIGEYNNVMKNRDITNEKLCNPVTKGCFATSWKFNDDIIYSIYDVTIDEDGTCKIPEEIVRLINDPEQLFLTDDSFINLINETFVDTTSEEYKRHLNYFAKCNDIDRGLLHHMVEDFESLKETVLENEHTLQLNPGEQFMVNTWYDNRMQQIVINYQLSQDLFKLVSYYKHSIVEPCDVHDIDVNRIDRMVGYHFTIRRKE